MEDLPMEDRVCRLEWNIHNPFLPSGRQHVIRFEHETLSSDTWWEASFEVNWLSLDYWSYDFSLKCVRPSRGYNHVKKLVIDIRSGESYLVRRKRENMLFKNEDTFDLRGYTETGRRHYYIEVFILVKEHYYFFIYCNYRELDVLSEDLKRLRNSSNYSDLCLHSNLAVSGHRVHSNIIQARWTNFFREHPEDTIVDRTVRMDISDELLNDILDYMYAGSGKLGDREIPSVEYMAELNHVIEKYELGHLRKNFEREPRKIVARVSNDLWITEKTFQVIGPPFETCTSTWTETLPPDVEIFFQFQFCLREDDLRFSYSLQFKSPNPLHTLVTIKYEKGRIYWYDEPEKMVHEREQSLSFDEELQRWTLQYEGELGEFREYMVGRLRPRRDRFHFILYVSTGSQNPASIVTERFEDLPDEEKRLEVLSDHMAELFSKYAPDGDLLVECHGDNPATLTRCHREIFTARVRRWRNIIREVIPEGDLIPNEVGCDVMSTTFRRILDFVYTGKLFSMPTREEEEFRNFARDGQLGSASLGI